MINRLIAISSLAASLCLSGAAFAETSPGMMGCSEANMTIMQDSMMKMSDASKRAAAMKEMDMAKSMMVKKDMKGCEMQMQKAQGMMK
jgi:hypothetical protein